MTPLRPYGKSPTKDMDEVAGRAQAYIIRAGAYVRARRVGPAQCNYKRAVATYERSDYAEHREALSNTYDLLVGVLCEFEEYNTALHWAQRAQRYFEEGRAQGNLLVHQILRTAFVYSEMAQFNMAEKLYWQAFSLEHPQMNREQLGK